MADTLQDFSGESYGEAAALLYDMTESLSTGFALQAAPQLWDLFSRNRTGPEHNRVLDVGCGTGQLANYFLARGADVTGLDRSAYMLKHAVEKNSEYVIEGRAFFAEADAAEFVFDEEFAFIVCTFNTLNHLATFNEVERSLACIFRALQPGGHFVCDINTRRGLNSTLATSTVHDTDDEIILRKRLYVDGRVILYASGCFRHNEIWHRYRETIPKIAIDTGSFRRALLSVGFDSATYAKKDFLTPEEDPEAEDVAYMVAQKRN